MTPVQLGAFRLAPSSPDGSDIWIISYDAMLQHVPFVAGVAMFGGPVPEKYFHPNFEVEYHYDGIADLVYVIMKGPMVSTGPKLLYLWKIDWENAGGGLRPTKVTYWYDDGSGREPQNPPADEEFPEAAGVPDVGAVGGGVDLVGYHTYTYSGTSPDDLTGATWTPAP